MRDYLHDGGVRHAIGELLRLDGQDDVLPSLEWRELPRYYEALAAAQRFRIDWMLFSQQAWAEVWPDIAPAWRPYAPHEQVEMEDGVQPTLANCCDTDTGLLWFGRVFHRGEWTLGTSVAAAPGDGLRFRMDGAGPRSWERISLTEFSDEMKGTGIWPSRVAASLDGETVDLSDLRAVARAALTEAELQIDRGFANPRPTSRKPIGSRT
ncbi:hypothetical protein [Sphingomonas sp. NFX23]|uniref:hypothetical protein n=1 Tax=Sphingomonas sp. NFX23 TaxID=2819532 RepID=UPI003CF6736A